MPSPADILGQLATIAGGWRPLAVAWHLYFGGILVGLIAGVRPSKRLIGALLAAPMLSVSLMAWLVGNPFNGSVFALAGAALIALSTRLPAGPVRIAAPWESGIGTAMFVFGWGYPHFLDEPVPSLQYLYAAPTGLIPCPTLSIVIGLTLMLRRLDSRAWPSVLAAVGVTYGIIGGGVLGVVIDWLLFLGAAVMLALTVHNFRRPGTRVS